MIIFEPPDESPLATSVPCIAELSVGGGAEIRWYGPFPSLLDAKDWCAKQLPTHFRIIPLRRTDKERTTNESWYYTDIEDLNAVIDEFLPAEDFFRWKDSQ